MTTTPTPEFSNDRPLLSKADDKLSRAPFAERVAGVLRGLPRGAGLVVGIHGPWGDGKTTVLNMLQADLDADGATATVEFNPWRFTDEPAMLAGFFQVLAGVIRAKLTTKGEDIAGWVEKIGRYASVVDDRLGKASEVAGAKAEASLEDLRSRLSEALAKADILISHLIRRLPAGEPRVALVKHVIEAADPLWFGDEIIRWLYVTDDADKADSNTLTKDEVKEVGKVLVERIKARAKAGEPLFNVDVPQEQSLLYEWWRVEGREPVQAHLASVFAKDSKNIAKFLQAMAPRSWGQNDVLPRVGRLDGDQLKNIKRIYDLDALAQLIRKHLPGDFENPQWFPDSSKPVEQRLAEQFMFVHNKWKKDGEPPDAMPENSGDSVTEDGDDDGDDNETS